MWSGPGCDNVRLPKKAYAMQLVLHNNGKMCWVSHISKTLYRFGFGFVWENQGVQNSNVGTRGLTTCTSQTDPPPRLRLLGNQLATMKLKIKTVTIPKRVGCTQQKLSPNLGQSVHLGRVARDWRTFCRLGRQEIGEDVVVCLFHCLASS